MKKLILVFLLVLPFGLSAQLTDPVSWDFELKKLGANEYEVLLSASVDPGWYIYSSDLSDDGPIPTSISYLVPEDLSVLEGIKEEGKKVEGFDEMFGMNIIKYSSKVIFSQKIKAEDLETLAGNVRFMTCDEHKCLPPKEIPFEVQPK